MLEGPLSGNIEQGKGDERVDSRVHNPKTQSDTKTCG